MDCNESRLLIDERVQGLLGPDQAALLNEHLQGCPDCTQDLQQLLKTRELLSVARQDAPAAGELLSIWQRIRPSPAARISSPPPNERTQAAARTDSAKDASMALPALSTAPVSRPGLVPAWRPSAGARNRRPAARWRLVALSSLVAAALLLLCFVVGQQGFRPPERLVAEQREARLHAVGGEQEKITKGLVDEYKSLEQPAPGDDELKDYAENAVGASPQADPVEGKEAPADRVIQKRNQHLYALTMEPVKPSGSAGRSSGEAEGASAGDYALRKGEEALHEKAKTAPESGGTETLSKGLAAAPAPKAPPLVQEAPPKPGRGEKQESRDWADPAQAVKRVSVGWASSEEGRTNQEADGKDGQTQAQAPGEPQAVQERPKIIKTGEITVEAKSFLEASRQAEALVVKHQGLVADSRVFDQPGGTRSGTLVIRCAPERFEELFSELKKIGNVLAERAGGQDITAQYVDTEARIKNLQVAEARLQELIKTKTILDKVESLLQVERELARVRGEIESYQGQMRVWQNQIGLSTIRLTLQEPARAVPSGSLSVEIPSLAAAKKALDGALGTVGGQLVSGQTEKRADGTLSGTYTLRVKFGRFGELGTAIKGLGRVEDERIANQPFGEAVPEGAQEVPCELALVLFERPVRLPEGRLELEVSALGEAFTKLNAALAAVQGTIVNNEAQRQPDGTTTANVTLRVKAGNFQALLEALPALGRVRHRTVAGESGVILGGAAEVPAAVQLCLAEQPKEVPEGSLALEVGRFSEGRERLSALIKAEAIQVLGADSRQRPDGSWAGSFSLGIKAERMDEVVGALEQLGRVKTRQLKGLGLGDLSKIEPNVMGRLQVSLEEPPLITPREEGDLRLFLRETFGGFLTSMGYIVRGLGVVLPWLVLFGLLGWLVLRWQRRREAVVAAGESAQTAGGQGPAPSGLSAGGDAGASDQSPSNQ